MAVAASGIDVRRSGLPLLFRFRFEDSAGNPINAGSASLRIFEYQADGSLKGYDFTSHAFVVGTPASPNLALTHQAVGALTNSGIWTAVESTVTGFTVGAVYLLLVTAPSGASAPYQEREFQYGGAEGDLNYANLDAAISSIPAQNIGLNCTVAGTPTPTVTSVTVTGTFDATIDAYQNQFLSIVGSATRKGQTALITNSTTGGISGATGSSVALTLASTSTFKAAPQAGDAAVICGRRPT
jgi:hypothetical protein